MKAFIVFVVVLVGVQSYATQIPFKDLTNLVADSEHVLLGTVTKVDMVDTTGKQITNETARTPDNGNQLRLHVTIATNGVIVSSKNKVPETIVIPIWQRWHDTLGNRKKEVQGKTFIFLLKGSDFEPVYHGLFMRKTSEQTEIERLLNGKPMQNQASEAIGGKEPSQPQR